MKMFIGGIVALFVTTAAFAQSAPPVGAMETPTNTITQPAPTGTPNDPAVSPTGPNSPGSTTMPMLTEKNGKWWNGERKATDAEIAEYKRSRPQ